MTRLNNRGPSLGTRGAVYAMGFLSGAAGLVYEISWSRQIGLLFGHTAQAAAVVLCAYFAGMGVGYAWAGRTSSRCNHPLRAYCMAELAVAGWAAVVPALVSGFDEPVLASAINSSNQMIQVLTRTALVFFVLLPATIGLGATLPFLAEFLDSGRDEGIGRFNTAYALNMAGGVAGVVSATAVLLVVVGVRGSGYLAAAMSCLCGVFAWITDLAGGSRATLPKGAASNGPRAIGSDSGDRAGRFLRLILASVSGFGILALEVLYTRLFALVFHNSTYTFGIVLTVCLLALSTGAALARRVGDVLGARSIVGICVMVSGAVPVSVIVFIAVTRLEYFSFGEGLSAYLMGAFGLVMLIVFAPVTLAGMLLPMVWRDAWGRSDPGQVIGRLTAASTIAGSVGALVTSFVALPLLGLWGAFGVVAIGYLGAPLVSALRGGPGGLRVPVVLAIVPVMLGVWVPRQRHGLEPTQELVGHWDSAYGWIDVVRDWLSGDMLMTRDVYHFMGSSNNLSQERWQADLPLLLHAKPAHTLFIGLGTGITAGEALAHPDVEQVTVVELIPEVVKAARAFDELSRNLLDDPRVHVVVNDGRHYLAATGKQFDVVVADLFVPWESHTGYLYTVEHYQAARKQLKPSGLYCQWLPAWQLRKSDLLMIVDSFASVFPHVGVWFGNMNPTFVLVGLVGSDRPIPIDASEVLRRMREGRTSSDLDPLGLGNGVLSLYGGEWQSSGGGAMNTDEHPRIEFLAPNVQFNKDEQLVLRERVLQALAPRLARRGPGSTDGR